MAKNKPYNPAKNRFKRIWHVFSAGMQVSDRKTKTSKIQKKGSETT